MKNLNKYQIALEKAKNEVKLYNAGLVIAEAFESNISRVNFNGDSEPLFKRNQFWFCGELSLTSKALTHFQYMSDRQEDSFLNKLKRALKLLEKNEDGKYYALEAHNDLTQ